MDFDFNVSTLLYVIGILLGIGAVIYFGREIIADLSPTVKSIILLVAFPAFLDAGNLIKKRFIDKFLYIVSVLSYLVFLWYISSTFDLGSSIIFLSLVISSVLFVGIGYLWEKGLNIEKNWKKGILAILLIFIVGLVSFDVVGAQPTYKLNLQDRVNFEGAWDEGSERGIQIGSLEVRNDFIFSRHTNPPYLRACLYTPERHEVYLNYPIWNVNIISGGSTEEIEISLYPPVDRDTGGPPSYMENIESIPIETAESCPDSVEEPKLVITTDGGPINLAKLGI